MENGLSGISNQINHAEFLRQALGRADRSIYQLPAKGNIVPSVQVNGGNFVFNITTKETVTGWVGTVIVQGVEVWTLPTAVDTQDAAWVATKRAVAGAFSRLLSSA